ncbi:MULTISPECIES: hypothetical protein [Asticcacaulis]|uniref:hypothetical protein n=1 Tax=Asticcacaulis TaxID=76890 RepID=UPI001AE890B2|nr:MULTISPECIES: hypothetical protein [Asticcacaulis]MBP2161640.1 hypothetical protein [Asticcacaulis solisilvae]MDR6802735.1 hypothetical protein [Asticcacaulis sp. BE141]
MFDPVFRTQLQCLLFGDTSGDVPVELLPRVDAWLASSLLQKAIRRGEVRLAQRAAATFYRWRPRAIWHRFMVIAFEDIGVASLDALAIVACAGLDPQWRKVLGSDLDVVCMLAAFLANVPKDRSPDHLICVAHSHPEYESIRERVGCLSLDDRLRILGDMSVPVATRAVAAWYCSGIEWGGERRIGSGDLGALLDRFQNDGVPNELLVATRIAAHRTKEPICVMVPLLWQEMHKQGVPKTERCAVPDAQFTSGVPSYAFDKHTRIGKAAIGRLARDNSLVRDCLEQYVADYRGLEAAAMAAFHTDASPVSLRISWEGHGALENLGIEADLMSVGVDRGGIGPLLRVFHEQLEHLNALRAELFDGKRRAA